MNTELIKVLKELKEYVIKHNDVVIPFDGMGGGHVVSSIALDKELDRLIKLYGGKE